MKRIVIILLCVFFIPIKGYSVGIGTCTAPYSSNVDGCFVYQIVDNYTPYSTNGNWQLWQNVMINNTCDMVYDPSSGITVDVPNAKTITLIQWVYYSDFGTPDNASAWQVKTQTLTWVHPEAEYPDNAQIVQSAIQPTECPAPPPPCEEENELKQIECGGIQYWDFDSVDPETCISKCKCEDSTDPYATTYQGLKEFCGGKKTDLIWDENSCLGECVGDCTYEYNVLEDKCGVAGINQSTWDEENCTGECNDYDCVDEIAQEELFCAPNGVNLSTWDYENCTGQCRQDCSEEYQALENECGIHGIAKFDQDTCTGTCKDCDYETNKCSKECSGFIKDFTCDSQNNKDGVLIVVETSDCECLPKDQWFVPVSGSVTGIGIGDGAGFYGGDTTLNPDGSVTETLENGSVIEYQNPTEDRPEGSIQYITPDGHMEEHYETPDGQQVVLSYDPETQETTQVTTTLVEGVWITTSEILDSNDPNVIGTTTTETSVSGAGSGSGTLAGTNTDEQGEETVSLVKKVLPVGGELKNYIRSKINLTPIFSAVDGFGDKYPMAIVSQISTLLDSMTASPVTPSWDVNLIPSKWGGSPIHIDLEEFNGLAELLRWFFAIGIWAVAIWQCIKIWTR